MAEKKSIVIKLKYPTGRIAEKDVFTPKTITEWNIKRIVCAVGALVAIAALVWYFAFSSSPQKNTADKTVTALPPATIASSPDVNGGIDKKDDTATAEPKKKVLRAQLTSKITSSEPVGEINSPIKAGEKSPVPVYYFAELADMKGKTVHHEWLLDNRLISKKTVNISDNTWRTSSRQMVAYTTNSNWTVRLVDENGQVLNEKKFTVALDK